MIIYICLIAYDVTFVFASDVMITVAKSFESPMKILILNKNVGFSMIGIGDIIIPGLLVSLCLRIDFIRNLIFISLYNKKKIESLSNREEVII